MSDVTTPELIRAYQFIEADELDQARSVLDSYLETHREDADAWWLYAHAVTDPMEAQNALRNVLRITPDYPGARVLLAESEQILTPAANVGPTGISRLASRPVPAEDVNRAPDFLDRIDLDDENDFGDFDSDDDFQTSFDDDFDDEFDNEFAEEDEEAAPGTSRRLQLLLIGALVIVVLIALVWAITGSSRNRNTVAVTPSVTSPAVAIIITDTPVVPVEATQEASPATETVTAETGNLDQIYAAMSGYTVIPESAGIENTSLGTTLIISICNDPEAGLVTTALNAIETLSLSSSIVSDQAEAVGVQVVDCARDNLILRTLGVSINDAQAYAQGTLSLNQLRAKVKPVS